MAADDGYCVIFTWREGKDRALVSKKNDALFLDPLSDRESGLHVWNECLRRMVNDAGHKLSIENTPCTLIHLR